MDKQITSISSQDNSEFDAHTSKRQRATSAKSNDQEKQYDCAWKGYALAVLAAVGWAAGALIGKWFFVSSSLVPEVLTAARALTSVAILAPLLMVFDRGSFVVEKLDGSIVKSIAYLALFGSLAMVGMQFTYFKTISLLNVATALLLEYLAPIVTLAAGALLYKQRFSWRVGASVVVALVGCAIVVGVFSPGGLVISINGLIWGLTSAVFFALYSLMGSHVKDKFGPFTMLVYGLLFASLTWMIALGPRVISEAFSSPSTTTVICILAMFSTVIPFGAFLMALHYISPTQATLTAMLEPLLAGLGGILLFGEPLTATLLIGGTLVLGAIAYIQTLPGEEKTQDLPHDI